MLVISLLHDLKTLKMAYIKKVFISLIIWVSCLWSFSSDLFSKDAVTSSKIFINSDNHSRNSPEVIVQAISEKFLENSYSKYLTLKNLTDFFFLALKLLIILSVAYFLWKLINDKNKNFVKKIVESIKKKSSNYNSDLIIKTAAHIVQSLLRWILVIVTALIALNTIGIDIMPIIYSFGVLGLAISIGSQALVKDVINGLLTLFDGNIAVGEVVSVNGNTGTIESISLRCIEFRHESGSLQIVPFSEIKELKNLSRGYFANKIKFVVANKANIEQLESLVLQTFEDMKKSLFFSHMIIEDVKFKGITDLDKDNLEILICFKTKPDPFKDFSGEFKNKLFRKFIDMKIPMPINNKFFFNNQ